MSVQRRSSPLRELLETLVVAVVLALLIRGFVVESFLVQGSSMEPTLHHGDRLLVNKIAYRFGTPQRGDIVVFHAPFGDTRDYIKRVIAGPGDRIRIEDGVPYVNGERLEEPYVLRYDDTSMPEMVIPPGSVFVMGDNRRNSQDSRSFGFIGIEEIVGKAMVVYWPLEVAGVLR
ncbi:MAG: signal peptidase I [Thermaerobacter sp.]|nr:signal peptidase I [Bacillota bacterium]REJ38093.1 MAG: signal peptidase I [Bacillota bacterium]